MTHTAKKSKLAAILVGAALAGALVPGVASAHHGTVPSDQQLYVNPSTGYASVAPSSKDYSKNSVNGEAAPAMPGTLVTDYSKNSANGQYVVPEPSSAVSTPVVDEPSDDGSDWSYAAIGAAAGLGFLLIAVGVSTKTRRRQLRRHMART